MCVPVMACKFKVEFVPCYSADIAWEHWVLGLAHIKVQGEPYQEFTEV